jgi:hypothetical protein
MLIDKQNLMSYEQAITVTANSANAIDLGPAAWNGAAGNAGEIPVFMHVVEAFTADGAATLTIAIQSSSVENFGSDVATHIVTAAIGKADLAQPKKMTLALALPADVKRYVRAVYTVATGPFTAGKLTLGVTAARQTNS